MRTKVTAPPHAHPRWPGRALHAEAQENKKRRRTNRSRVTFPKTGQIDFISLQQGLQGHQTSYPAFVVQNPLLILPPASGSRIAATI